jgi:hypothetical protein
MPAATRRLWFYCKANVLAVGDFICGNEKEIDKNPFIFSPFCP